jgi:hypothetical protein
MFANRHNMLRHFNSNTCFGIDNRRADRHVCKFCKNDSFTNIHSMMAHALGGVCYQRIQELRASNTAESKRILAGCLQPTEAVWDTLKTRPGFERPFAYADVVATKFFDDPDGGEAPIIRHPRTGNKHQISPRHTDKVASALPSGSVHITIMPILETF